MRDKIYYDIKEATYFYTIYNIRLYFSSKFYMNKYKNEVEGYINREAQKIKVKYKLNINMNLLLALSYYKKIEKRGFYAYNMTKEKEIKENEVFTLEF